MQPTSQKINQQAGFTLVEMLVVAPIMVLIIAGFVGLMVNLTGDALVSTARSNLLFETQDALNQIEQDAAISMAFSDSLTAPVPQMKADSSGTFEASAGDIILSQPATNDNPYNPARSLVYYSNQPLACGAPGFQSNNTFAIQIVYFIREESGIKSLYRRTIVPATAAGSLCATPWQRNSCRLTSLNPTICQAKDSKLLTNVDTVTVSYFNKANPSVSVVPASADSLKVTLKTAVQAAGKPISNTLYLTATRNNRT